MSQFCRLFFVKYMYAYCTVDISHVSDSRSGKRVINKKIKPASTNTRHIKTDVIIRPVLAYHSNKLTHPMACGKTPRGAAFNQSR